MTVLSGPKPRLPADLRAQGNYSAVEFCLGCMHHTIKTRTADLPCTPESVARKFVFYSYSMTNSFQNSEVCKAWRNAGTVPPWPGLGIQSLPKQPHQPAPPKQEKDCESCLDDNNTLVFETLTSSMREINKSIQTQGDCAMVEGSGERVVLKTQCLF